MEENYLKNINEPVRKRSIKDIPIPNHRPRRKTTSSGQSINLRKEKQADTRASKKMQPEKDPYQDPYMSEDVQIQNSSSKKNWFWIGGGILGILVIILLVSGIFSKTTVEITPKTENISNLNISVPLIEAISSNSESALSYKAIEIEKKVSKNYPADGEESVETKASGVITIYNSYSTENQRLIQNTRFESTDGLIYRIQDSIDVPGYTESEGEKTPGSIDVTVYADEAGENYNGKKTDFTIPGFEGAEQFDFFYAKAKTDFTGGFEGVRKNLSEENQATASQELQSEVTDEIIKQASGQVTDDYYFSYTPESFTFSSLELKNAANGNGVEASITGIGKVIIIKKDDIATKIAEKEIGSYSGDPVEIKNFDQLVLSVEKVSNQITDTENEDEVQTVESTNLNIEGDAILSWIIDTESIKNDLLGAKRSDLISRLAKYSGVAKATSYSVPFGWGDLPNNPNKIEIKLTE